MEHYTLTHYSLAVFGAKDIVREILSHLHPEYRRVLAMVSRTLYVMLSDGTRFRYTDRSRFAASVSAKYMRMFGISPTVALIPYTRDEETAEYINGHAPVDVKNYYPNRESLTELAIRDDNLFAVKWLTKHGRQRDANDDERDMQCALYQGNIDIIRWFCDNNYPIDTRIALCYIGRHDNCIETLDCLKGCAIDGLMDIISRSANLATLKYCHALGHPLSHEVFRNATWRNYNPELVEMLEWFTENKCVPETVLPPVVDDVQPHLDWCKRHNIVLRTARDMCVIAANCDLDTLKRVRAAGCEWNSEVLIDAIRYDMIENVMWLIENGCPYNEHIISIAIKYGHFDLARLMKTRLGFAIWSDALVNVAVYHAPLEFVCEILDNQDTADIVTINLAAKRGDVEIAEYIIHHHWECGVRDHEWAFVYAARYGHLEVMKKLTALINSNWSVAAYFMAARIGRLDIIKWLCDNHILAEERMEREGMINDYSVSEIIEECWDDDE